MDEVADTGFDWADIVDEAVDRSGGQAATASDILKLRRSLRLLTERWNMLGYNLWRVTTKVFPLAGPAAELQLPRCVDDVVHVAYRRPTYTVAPGYEWLTSPAHTADAGMRRISEAEYASLASKATHGASTQFCLRRSDPPTLLLYPIGDPDRTAALVITYVERPARFERYDSVDDGEVPGRWLNALVLGLAADLARKRPPYNEELIERLDAEAGGAERLAETADRGRQRYRYRIGRMR